MNNYKIIVQYDGTNYSGWQIQPDRSTIQGTLSRALSTVLRENIKPDGSGRTDTGVHALGQTASFKSSQRLDIHRIQYAVNSILPDDIAITSMEEALPDFHARFSAKSRSYLYLIAAIKTPFYKNYSHYDYMPLSITGLNELSEVLTGEQDYASFTKNAADADSTICNVTEFRWRRTGAFILMKISANRFLHGMVRALCGTVISVYKKGGSTEDVKKILDAEDRTEAAMSVPAKGLFLWKVHYD